MMLMGSVEELKVTDSAEIARLRDEALEQEKAIKHDVVELQPGLLNLGNTCYLNSTLQVFRAMPELTDSLHSAEGAKQFANSNILSGLSALYAGMSKLIDEPFNPVLFLALLRQKYPQFAERNQEGGMYSQQDADECWGTILTEIKQNLKLANGTPWIDLYMTGTMAVTTKCLEAPDEEPKTEIESFQKLPCHITVKTNFMTDGIMDSLCDSFEKNSPSLNRNAKYEKRSEITRLPKYLVVNFVRFYWKASIRKKAKIMRQVKFPFELDASQYCAPALRTKVIPVREKYREINSMYAEQQKARKRAKIEQEIKTSNGVNDGTVEIEANEADTNVDSEKCSYEEALEKLHDLIDPELAKDEGSNPTGLYDLVGVLTHQGASADSGHYQAWIKSENADDKWLRFNDEKVTIVGREKIESLSGGGESDVAYIMLYKAKSL